MTRVDGSQADDGRAIVPARALVDVLVAVLAVLTLAVAGPASATSSPWAGASTAGELALGGHPVGGGPSAMVVQQASRHPSPTPPWPGPAWGLIPDQLLGAALLTSVLLALVRLHPRSSPLPHALPPRRGPPHLAFLR